MLLSVTAILTWIMEISTRNIQKYTPNMRLYWYNYFSVKPKEIYHLELPLLPPPEEEDDEDDDPQSEEPEEPLELQSEEPLEPEEPEEPDELFASCSLVYTWKSQFRVAAVAPPVAAFMTPGTFSSD